MKDAIRAALPGYRKQFDGGRRPITDREIAQCMIMFDGMALRGPDGAAALAALRAMPAREAEDVILGVMRDAVV